MIPLKLQLKNFLSYGPELQIINFEPYSLICLSGKNGHGKSALLDAITWALWGQARKISGTAKSDEALLHIGQTQMIVIFDFFCNNQTYRIRREYMKTYGKPYVAVNFGILNQKNDTFISISGKTIRTTQTIIERTINIDFDSFINSAFLRQGQANEFSKKSPKERKEILGTILGLGTYETIRKLATEKTRQATIEKTSLLMYQEKIIQELATTKTVSEQLTSIEQQLSTITQKEGQYAQKHQTIENKRKQLLEKRQQQQLFSLKLEHLIKEEVKQQEILRTTYTKWKTIHAKQLHLPDYYQLELHKKQLVETINKHQLQFQQSLELKEQYLAFQEQLQHLMQELQKKQHQTLQQQAITVERLTFEKQFHEQQIEQLKNTEQEHKKEYQAIKQERNLCCTELQKLDSKLQKQTSIIKQFEKRKEYYQKFVTQSSLMQQNLTNLVHKQRLAHDDTNPSCPLCEQNLSASRRRFLKQKFIKEEHFLKHKINHITNVLKKLKELLITQHKEVDILAKTAEQQKLLQLQQEDSEKKCNKLIALLQSLQEKQQVAQKGCEQAVCTVDDAARQLEERKKNSHILLENNQTYQIKKQESQKLVKQLTNVQYQPEIHNQARTQLQQVEEQLSEYQKDLEQIAAQDQRKQTIHELCLALKKFKQEKSTIQKALAPFSDLVSHEEMLKSEEQMLVMEVQKLNKHKETLLQEKGRLEQQQQKHNQLEQELTQYKQKVVILNETIDDYQAIAMATSKDGIQALLIQDILPEIEQEANALLAKLTDNQSQIFIESLRDLKKGGTKETLDIKISDTIGIRSYELFSGGEAFRIDFALRIAISKFLARRAGTSLQTLIIDEGFGSQDEDGLSHIMDAIYKIQDDFAKVIIVSHLSFMKDLFPVHFLVEKGFTGSTVTVLEQG